MLRLLILTTAAAAAYAGYWALGARSTLSGAEALAQDLRAAGWEAGWSERSLAGFPSRLDLTLEAPFVTLPGGDGWAAPFVQSLQLTYRRNRAILVFPDSQALRLAGTDIAVQGSGLRASVHGAEVTAEAGRLALAWEGHALSGGPVLAALRPLPGEDGVMQLYLRAEAAEADGAALGTLVAEGRAVLDAPLAPGRVPQVVSVELTGLETGDPAALAAVLARLSPAAAAAVEAQRQ